MQCFLLSTYVLLRDAKSASDGDNKASAIHAYNDDRAPAYHLRPCQFHGQPSLGHAGLVPARFSYRCHRIQALCYTTGSDTFTRCLRPLRHPQLSVDRCVGRAQASILNKYARELTSCVHASSAHTVDQIAQAPMQAKPVFPGSSHDHHGFVRCILCDAPTRSMERHHLLGAAFARPLCKPDNKRSATSRHLSRHPQTLQRKHGWLIASQVTSSTLR